VAASRAVESAMENFFMGGFLDRSVGDRAG
jgi:hypothetical protein